MNKKKINKSAKKRLDGLKSINNGLCKIENILDGVIKTSKETNEEVLNSYLKFYKKDISNINSKLLNAIKEIDKKIKEGFEEDESKE
jgi:hypothetical protein